MPSLFLALVLTAAASDRIAVIGLSGPPGPVRDLVEVTRQLRAAARERHTGVLSDDATRAPLLRGEGAPSLAELDREYERAVAAYRMGDYRPAVRTLRNLLVQLEAVPEGIEAHAQWLRAALRLAHAELTIGNRRAYRALLEQVALVDPHHEPDPEQFSPTFRRDLAAAKRRVAARPTRSLSIVASGAEGEVFVNGRPLGPAPVRLRLPPGRHRVGGAAGTVRVPTLTVELGSADEAVSLEFDVAAALSVDAGPALLVPEAEEGHALATFARWVGVARVVSVRRASQDGTESLVGALHDGGDGTVVREGRVHLTGPRMPAEAMSALAAFLLTGAPSPLVNGTSGQEMAATTPRPADPPPAAAPDLRVGPETESPLASPAIASATSRPRWMKPAAIGSAGLALGLAAFATQQLVSSRSSYDDADALVRPDGVIADSERYRDLVSSGDRAKRNAWIGAGGAVVFAATAGVLGYLTWTDAGPAVRF